MPSHLARSSARGHQSPPATHLPWLGFRASAPALVAMSSSSRMICREERRGDSLAVARDKAAMEFLLLLLWSGIGSPATIV